MAYLLEGFVGNGHFDGGMGMQVTVRGCGGVREMCSMPDVFSMLNMTMRLMGFISRNWICEFSRCCLIEAACSVAACGIRRQIPWPLLSPLCCLRHTSCIRVF